MLFKLTVHGPDGTTRVEYEESPQITTASDRVWAVIPKAERWRYCVSIETAFDGRPLCFESSESGT